ncbi:MAG: DUF3891 family protein [Phycisphaerae bacterium]|nr:DUF3891 family protein [Phycisphaerae bacterium]MDW8261046.1 DUF3891 family protein [Phycisphaerales bacterium]
MIRREVNNQWWLVSQDDHARLAGDLAAELGGIVQQLDHNVIQAVALHDCGWIEADAAPMLDPDGRPMDVFQTPLPRGMQIWRESSRRALQEAGPRAGLLVSIHSLALSANASARLFKQSAGSQPDLRLAFAVNKFQHAEIEQQEHCRRRLGLRLDLPLMLGLAPDSPDPGEQQLLHDFRWLSAMDRLSLNLCCTDVPFPVLGPLTTTPGGRELIIHVTRREATCATLDPWPFARDQVSAKIPCKRMAADRFVDEQSFRYAFTAAAVEELHVELRPAGALAT